MTTTHYWILRTAPLAALSFSLLGTAPAANAGITNLIADGSFENPATLVGSYSVFSGGSQVGSWSAAGVEVALVNSAYVASGFTFQAQSGSQWMDLSGGSNPNPSNRVSQTIATAVGDQYELSFYIGSAWGGPPQMLQPIVDVSIGGIPAGQFANRNAATGGSMNWQQYSVMFTALNTATSIVFQYGNAATPLNYVVGLDTVSVVTVPAPGALAALAAAALGMKRRRPERNRPPHVR